MKNKNLEERVKNGYLYKKEPIKLYLKEVCMRCCFFDGYMCCKRRDVFPELKHSVCNAFDGFHYSKTPIIRRDKNGRFVSKKENTVTEKEQVGENPMRYFLISYVVNDVLNFKIGSCTVKSVNYPDKTSIDNLHGKNTIPLYITELSEKDYMDFLK